MVICGGCGITIRGGLAACPRCGTRVASGVERAAGIRGTLGGQRPAGAQSTPPPLPSASAARPPVDPAVPPKIEGLEGLALIGTGSFSTVFRARQPALDRVVAAKVLKVSLDDPSSQSAFEDECTATGRLSEHPNIATVHGSGQTVDGRPFILMSHYSGGSLAARATGGRQVSLAETLRIGVKLSSSLEAAHVAGVLHCDVKPGNILMSRYGEPMLGDFGIATIRLGGPSSSMLTPNFAAPEVLLGAPPSQTTDLYSLAATLFVLLTGRPPFAQFPGERTEVMGERIRSSPLPALEHPEVDAVTAVTILAPLAVDPFERPRSALAYGRSLQELQARLGLSVTDLPGAPSPVGITARVAVPLATAPAVAPIVTSAGRRAPIALRAQAATIDVAAAIAATASGIVLSQVVPEAPVPTLASSVLAATLTVFAYHLLFAGLVGPTPGRSWAGLTLERRGRIGALPMGVALGRCLIGIGSAVPLGIGYWAGVRGADDRTWPDHVTNTSVVRSTKQAPGAHVAATAAVFVLCALSIAIGTCFLFGTT